MTEDGIPTTSEEVDELVSKAPPLHETHALIEAAKNAPPVEVQILPRFTTFLQWLSVAMVLIVIIISMATLIEAKNTNNSKAECRAVIAGDLNIAKADGIAAGNRYQEILGQILVDAINRTNTDNFPAQATQLQAADDELHKTNAEMDEAVQKQHDILKICK